MNTSITRSSGTVALLWMGLLSGMIGCDGATTAATVPESVMLHATGTTMGTKYEVKISDPPKSLTKDWKLELELELRTVNDQMSTYIKRSEISRFNTSDSTDWFSVSPETAKVVAAALDISKKTKGAFDITVAPLVNLWSFGPERRERAVPSDEAISAAREQIGYRHVCGSGCPGVG